MARQSSTQEPDDDDDLDEAGAPPAGPPAEPHRDTRLVRGRRTSSIEPGSLSELPSHIREQVELLLMSGPAPRGPDQLLAKIPDEKSPEALASILQVASDKGKREHDLACKKLDASNARHLHRMWFAGSLILTMLVVIIVCILQDKDELVKTLLPALLAFAAGGAGGYGLGTRRGDDK